MLEQEGSGAEQLLFENEHLTIIYGLLHALNQNDRSKYGLWVANRLRPNYERLAQSMNWNVDFTIQQFQLQISEQIEISAPNFQKVRLLVQSLPEGEEGCSVYWSKGIDFLSAINELIIGLEERTPLPFAKLFQICCDHVDRAILNDILGSTSGPHSSRDIREMNSNITNHPLMLDEFSAHEEYLISLSC